MRNRTKVHAVKIKQGVVHVTADTKADARAQARVLEWNLRDPRVSNQTQIEPGVYALGTLAKKSIGVPVYER